MESGKPFMQQQFRFVAIGCFVAVAITAAPAYAQVDFTGNWGARYQEDQPERIPGPELGDYLGLPITDGARQFAESWDPGRIALPEEQCRVHVSPYIYRGPIQLRVAEIRDPETQELIAITHTINTYDQKRTIWMDGRPHPDEYEPHTWMGFSTGRWEGDRLVVTTTHLKQGWHRRNGLPMSDQATLTEHFVRLGDVMARISVTRDPVYLTEPLVKSEEFILNTRLGGALLYGCKPVVEVADHQPGDVPHFLPGENDNLLDFRKNHNLPETATRGGAETMYPEFAEKLKQAK
jgi:hypothetical protein